MLVNFSDVPCFICKPKTLGECGHPIDFMDDEWMAEQSAQKMREFGAKVRYDQEMAVLNSLLEKPRRENRIKPISRAGMR